MPGRFFMQKFLRDAVSNRCDYAVLEMTSEGVSLSRHRFIALDALVFTNLSPEHIEAHGSFEKYRDAKRKLGLLLENSRKSWRAIIANTDDAEGMFYLGLSVPRSFPYSLAQAQPHKKTAGGFVWTFRGELIESRLPGIFNLYNTLAAATFAVSQDIKDTVIKRALESFSKIRGRVEYVDEGQSFATVVDYAHTIDSLKQFYEIFSENHNICVLGNTGGGRDSWKRKGMAKVAETHCNHIILTNEDPYDEDPASIVDQMSEGITKKDKLSVVMDRREAIAVALKMANTLEREKGPGNKGVNVLITGKGTDPYIMGAEGHKEPWDDARVVREELRALLKKT